jgi:hypothetical protein
MSGASFEEEMAANRKAYEGLREVIRRRHAGQYVALAAGRRIAACPTYDETVAVVRRLRPAPEHFLIFPADEEPDFEPYHDG